MFEFFKEIFIVFGPINNLLKSTFNSSKSNKQIFVDLIGSIVIIWILEVLNWKWILTLEKSIRLSSVFSFDVKVIFL